MAELGKILYYLFKSFLNKILIKTAFCKKKTISKSNFLEQGWAEKYGKEQTPF
jgi:hypothetical protein